MLVAIAGVIALLASASSAFAVGRDYTVVAHDIDLKVDAKWTGGAYGGYYPIRVRATNKGPARRLMFEFRPLESRGNQLPVVIKTVDLEQNATARFTLSIPLVSQGYHGTLSVSEDGEELSDFRLSVAITEPPSRGENRLSMLVISDRTEEFRSVEAATASMVANFAARSSSLSGYPSGSSYSSPSASLDHEVVDAGSLPDRWLDYSGIDFVVIDFDALGKITADARRAIVEWVECGGTLLVRNVREAAKNNKQLETLLDLPSRAESSSWVSFDREIQHRTAPPDEGDAEWINKFAWQKGSDSIASRNVMLGTVYAFVGDPLPGTTNDWFGLLMARGTEQLLWAQRQGTYSRGTNSDFLHFLIPGVSGVPSTAFLVLITLFTLIIGPLNYIILARKGRQYLLLLTIPAVAFVTSLSLFGYSTIAHGFGVKSRMRSLTVLDQGRHTAVTTSRNSLFAGLSPSRGLQFEESTAVYPIWSNSLSFESGSVDWTQSQAFSGHWLPSRTRTQYMTHSHRIERGRLEFIPQPDGRLRVSNGLEWDIELLVVADDKGKRFTIENLPAGGSAEMPPATQETYDKVADVLASNTLEPPDKLLEDELDDLDVPFGRSRYSRFNARESANSSSSQMELQIRKWRERHEQMKELQPKSYLAILKQQPAVDLGLDKTTEYAGFHLLLGYY